MIVSMKVELTANAFSLPHTRFVVSTELKDNFYDPIVRDDAVELLLQQLERQLTTWEQRHKDDMGRVAIVLKESGEARRKYLEIINNQIDAAVKMDDKGLRDD